MVAQAGSLGQSQTSTRISPWRIRKGAIVLAGFFVLSIGIVTEIVRAQPSQADGPEQTKRIEAVLQAKPPYRLFPAYRALFREIKPEELQRLKNHAHDGIAMQAAWEEVRLSLPPVEQKKEFGTLERERLTRLLGFIEGRLRTTAPEWWQKVLLDVQANHRDNVRSSGRQPPTLAPIRLVSRDEKAATLQVLFDKQTVVLPAEVMGKESHLVGLVSGGSAYVASPFPLCWSFRLFKVDVKSRKILWEALVNAAGDTQMYSGPAQWFHWVALQVEGDRLFVFGAAIDAIYIEAFKTSDGSSLFRFGTGY